MTGIYLSGTGNTEHCIKKFLHLMDPAARVVRMEDSAAREALAGDREIVLGYPTQFSNAPRMVRDFITENADLFDGKIVFLLVTMGAFAGDVTGCAARILRKEGARVIGAMQIKMPDSVCDSRFLKKTREENVRIIKEADQKIEQAVKEIRKDHYPREGLSFVDHVKGLFGQRLWYSSRTRNYSDRLKISSACIGCGLCVRECPMHNLIQGGGPGTRPVPSGRCTMCYRCISRCPVQAITCVGKNVIEQTRYEKFIKET